VIGRLIFICSALTMVFAENVTGLRRLGKPLDSHSGTAKP
jgi:hypothetical protein